MVSSTATPTISDYWKGSAAATGPIEGSGASAALFSHLQPVLGLLERGFDFLTVVAGVYYANTLYAWLPLGKQAHYATRSFLSCAAGFGLLFVILLERHGAYRPFRSLLAVRETERILRVTVEAFLFALLLTYFTQTSISRLIMAFAVLLVPILVMLQKWEVYRLTLRLRKRSYGTRRAVILGAGTLGRRIYSALVRSPKFGLDAVAFVDDDPQKQGREVYESSYRRKQPVSVLPGPVSSELLRRFHASALVIATSRLNRDMLLKLATEASAAGAVTYYIPQDFSDSSWIDYEELDGMMLAHFHQAHRPGNPFSKRLLDATLSTAALVFFLPLLAIIALLVKVTSPAPVLFRQRRIGKNERAFEMYKFRTMFVDAAPYARSPESEDDPRITPLGRWLRRSSLDELPQLLNVLRGDMSLVGPRPEMPYVVEQYTPLQRQRLVVKPGLTGLWQLSGDRTRPIHENLEYDVYYVRNRNVWMDVAILLHTFLFAARGV